MTKKIAVKYTFFIVTVITVVMLVFMPIYTFVQNSIFIDLEKKEISSFCKNLCEKNDLSDAKQIEKYIDKNDETDYNIAVYSESKKRIFTNSKSRKPERSAQTRKGNTQLRNKPKAKTFSNYKANAVPVYKENEENGNESITLKTFVKTSNGKFYVFIREKLKNSEAIFSYTNNVLILVIVAYIIVCGLMLFLLMRRLTKSIRSLNKVVKKISEKDYSVRYEGKLSKDEVGTLAVNFNNMADTIQDNINSISNYNFLLKEDLDHLKKYENMRSKFVRNTTHELKTPLAIISSQVEMMNCTKDEEKRKYYFESAMEEIQKVSSLITGFLKYSADETEVLKELPEKINLSDKIEDLCRKITGNMQYKKIKFSYNIEPGLVLNFVESHIEHIFNNYIMNAIKHSPRGGNINVTLKADSDTYKLSIYNDGNKIPENKLDEIWTEFYSENKSDENVGLGLFIVKEISVINHTKCGVSNCNNGVEFWFEFLKNE